MENLQKKLTRFSKHFSCFFAEKGLKATKKVEKDQKKEF